LVNIKEPENKTNKRLVCYVKDDDFIALQFLADKYCMKVAAYLRFLVEGHIKLMHEDHPEEFEEDLVGDSP